MKRSREAGKADPNNTVPDSKAAEDRQLDEALKETFPGSDPFSVGQSSREPRGDIDRPPAPINVDTVKQLAKKAARKKPAAPARKADD